MTRQTDNTADEDYEQGVVPLTERYNYEETTWAIPVDTGTHGGNLTSSAVWDQEFHGRIDLFPPMDGPGMVLELALRPEMYEEFERTAKKHGGDPTDLMRDLMQSAAFGTNAGRLGLEVDFDADE